MRGVVVAFEAPRHDELHQERVAHERGRPVENRWIGQRIADPNVDLALFARSQGALGFGPVERPEGLVGVLEQAIEDRKAPETAKFA